MKLIKPSFLIKEQEPGLLGIYRQIEYAGRICYKSSDKITPTSAEEFVNRMIKSGHHAMLEFGTVYLIAKNKEYIESHGYLNPLQKYEYNQYSKVKFDTKDDEEYYCVTTNYRVLVENSWLDDLQYLCEPTEYHEKRICVRFTTDRGISHELVRHRVFSFAQESTRYCDYSKDKFNSELTFIIPSWTDSVEDKYWMTKQEEICSTTYPKMTFGDMPNTPFYILYPLLVAEQSYFNLLKCGKTPQQARQVLPNALKTEINMCGFISDWKHFFDLRDSSHAHPDMQALAKPLHQKFINRKLLE